MFHRTPNPASLTPEQRIEYRNAVVGVRYSGNRTDLPDGSCYYANEDGPGRFILHAFAGKALRPSLIESYRTRERRDERVAAFVASRERNQQRRTEQQAERRKLHTLKVGDILNTCWGYEQTNVEFYEVVGIRGTQVLIRQLAAETTETGNMSGIKMPIPGKYIGDVQRKRANGHNCVKIESFITASPWDGKPCRVSWYG